MQQLRRSTVSRAISVLLAAILLTPQCLMYLSSASAQTGQNVPAVAVIPFEDLTGTGSPGVMREATAAAALALEDSKEYLVTSTQDLEREMLALRLTPPLSVEQQIRLGERLHVEKVLIGSLNTLAVDSATGRAHVALRLQMLDVSIGEYLDGAAVDIYTKAIPGFAGDVAQVTHEALRAAAEKAVGDMLGTSTRRGSVDLVDDQGNISINLGTQDGLEVGSELKVLRPTWQPDVERVIMREVGTIRIQDIEANMATARSVSGSIPTTGDRIYRVYKPVSVMQAEAKSRKIKSTGQMLAGVLLLFGLFAVANGDTTATPSEITSCFLFQDAPGIAPQVELDFNTPGNARDATHGFLIFRAANNAQFPAVARYLIDMFSGLVSSYTDDPTRNDVTEDQEILFQFKDVENQGELTDGSVTASYNHTPLVAGERYFYRIRRITDPLAPPGSNPPIGTAQVTPVVPVITADPDERVLTDPSNTCGPVTFFTVPLQSLPTNGASNLPTTTGITFSWQTTVGANEYIVEVFPSTDPDGLLLPVLQSTVLRSTGSTIMSTVINGPFSSNTTYYWRVGARQSSDPNKPVNKQTGKQGFLYSTMRSFSTAISPPPPPGSTTAQPRPVPTHHGGWWGGGSRTRR
ncbi:MAG: hypothetical protein ACM3VW_06945 [Bacteroidota bacterium]